MKHPSPKFSFIWCSTTDAHQLNKTLVNGCLFWQVGSSKVCFCNFYNILPYVINSGSEIVGAVGECTVGSIFDAKSPIVSVMDTHARFIIFQMIAAFCVTCRPVKIGAPVNKQKNQNINKKVRIQKKFKIKVLQGKFTDCRLNEWISAIDWTVWG